jgi:hypothetical protein
MQRQTLFRPGRSIAKFLESSETKAHQHVFIEVLYEFE